MAEANYSGWTPDQHLNEALRLLAASEKVEVIKHDGAGVLIAKAAVHVKIADCLFRFKNGEPSG